MLQILYGGYPLEHETLTFPGGEVHVTVKPKGSSRVLETVITVHICNSSDVMELLMVTDALRRLRFTDIRLVMPYLPYARQDRVANPGEALSLKVFCNLINSQNYSSVTVWDCHSDVGLALLDRVINIPQSSLVKSIPRVTLGTVLVSPDAGALKKIYKCAESLDCDIICASKIRDTETGNITDTKVSGNIPTFSNMLIVDDICDGGRTFIELARALRGTANDSKYFPQGEIHLYVTHGIFSQGLDVFKGLIDKIYCPNVWPNIPDHPILQRS